MSDHDATYSPEDNKLRLYPACRLPKDQYNRLRAAGFRWAPKQELFVAPAWTPEREDLLLELCGDIGDEDTSLAERAEQRADRFSDYSDSRSRDATTAREAVDQLAGSIPLGQPILIGHHSEKRARRDAKRIEDGMRRAVTMWRRAEYWQQRAAGARRHADYKQRPDVRARRIRKLEADQRKQQRRRDNAEKFLKLWDREPLTEQLALAIANHDGIYRCFPLDEYPRDLPASQYEGSMSIWSAIRDGVITPQQARDISARCHESTIEWADRWIEHFDNRIAYERAMLDEDGGAVAERTKPEKGGAVRCWCSPGRAAGWSYVKRVNKVSVTVWDNWGNGGDNFTRTVKFEDLRGVMTAADVQAAQAAGRLTPDEDGIGFFLRPAEQADQTADQQQPPEPTNAEEQQPAEPTEQPTQPPTDENVGEVFRDMQRVLAAGGVEIATSPDLYPTPGPIVRQMIELARIEPGAAVLEPSAGTGEIAAVFREVSARHAAQAEQPATLQCVEINLQLAERLGRLGYDCRCSDFLDCTPEQLGRFDVVLMNPPFSKGADIKHIEHARQFLRPGGRVVAICANGPRQQQRLRDQAEHWQDLPDGSFAHLGTSVRTALCVLTAPGPCEQPEPAAAACGGGAVHRTQQQLF